MQNEARLNFELRPIDLVILENTCGIRNSEAKSRKRSTARANDMNDARHPVLRYKEDLKAKICVCGK
jgi:hypothetical protein